jgi:hypothetical protein
LAAAVVVVGMCVSFARAEVGGKEFDLSIGYAHLSLSGSAGPFDDRDGIRVEPRFSFGAGGATSGLRFGIGVGISGFEKSHDEDFFVIDDDGDVFEFDGDSVESITLITPEIQLSWRQMLGPVEGESSQRRWFVEPGVGLGVVFAQYWVGDTFGFAVDTDISEWDTTIAARPFLRAGWSGDRWVFGLEGSYLFGGNLDFTDEVGGDLEEWYVGAFFGARW